MKRAYFKFLALIGIITTTQVGKSLVNDKPKRAIVYPKHTDRSPAPTLSQKKQTTTSKTISPNVWPIITGVMVIGCATIIYLLLKGKIKSPIPLTKARKKTEPPILNNKHNANDDDHTLISGRLSTSENGNTSDEKVEYKDENQFESTGNPIKKQCNELSHNDFSPTTSSPLMSDSENGNTSDEKVEYKDEQPRKNNEFTGQQYNPTQVTINLNQEGFLPHSVGTHLVKKDLVILSENGNEYKIPENGQYEICEECCCNQHFDPENYNSYRLHQITKHEKSKNASHPWPTEEIKPTKGTLTFTIKEPTYYYVTNNNGEVTDIKHRAPEFSEEYKQYRSTNKIKEFPFYVKVETLINTEIQIQIEKNITVEDLKKRIQQKEGVPPEQFRLEYCGSRVKDEKKYLKSLGINDSKHPIVMELRLRGGSQMDDLKLVKSLNKKCQSLPKMKVEVPIWRFRTPKWKKQDHFTNNSNKTIHFVRENKVTLTQGTYKYCRGYINKCKCGKKEQPLQGNFFVVFPSSDDRTMCKKKDATIHTTTTEGGVHTLIFSPTENKEEKHHFFIMPAISFKENSQYEEWKSLDRLIADSKYKKECTIKVITKESTKEIQIPKGLSYNAIHSYLCYLYPDKNIDINTDSTNTQDKKYLKEGSISYCVNNVQSVREKGYSTSLMRSIEN